jgi:competence protein ComFC
MYSYTRKLFSLLFPHFCASCGSESAEAAICSACRKTVRPNYSDVFTVRGVEVRYLFEYHNPLICNLISLFKYDGIVEIANFFGDQACLFLEQDQLALDQDWIITWVPMHPRRMRIRGFNQSELVARLIADYFGARAVTLLEKQKQTKPQAKLNRENRLLNLEGAFKLSNQLTERQFSPVLLIDDVCTTGSTLFECVQTLDSAGFKEIYPLVLARD